MTAREPRERREEAVRLDLRGLDRFSAAELEALGRVAASHRDSAPPAWILLLGDRDAGPADDPVRLVLVADIVHALLESGAPMLAAIDGIVSGESLGFALLAYRAAATPGSSVRLAAPAQGPGQAMAWFLLSLKLGMSCAERLLQGPATLEAKEACEAGLLSCVTEAPIRHLDAWMRSAPLCDGTAEARQGFRALRWRFHAAARTGLAELSDFLSRGPA